ncbi:MAG: hypothetical protein HZA01_15530 [Nitrospinae bacterium]|nr:hypothetical protein [Nitrospinota bacterium]
MRRCTDKGPVRVRHPFAYEIFCRHLDKGTTVEEALSDLAPAEKELKAFTLLEATYEKLSAMSKDLLQQLSVLEEAFPMEAMQWMAEGKDIAREAEEIMGWGLCPGSKGKRGPSIPFTHWRGRPARSG